MDILAAITAVAPIVMQLLGFINAKNASDTATLKAYNDLLDAAHKNGLITVQMKDDYSAMQDQLAKQFAAPAVKKG